MVFLVFVFRVFRKSIINILIKYNTMNVSTNKISLAPFLFVDIST